MNTSSCPSELTIKRFIALDIGTKTGYVVFDGYSFERAGHLTLPRPLKGQFLKLYDLIKQYNVAVVCYECTDWHRPAAPQESFYARQTREKINRQVQRALGRKEGMIEAAAAVLGIEAVPILVHAAKRSVTKNGNASKEKVSAAVKELFGEYVSPKATQDELDAYSVACGYLESLDKFWKLKVFQDTQANFTF